MKRFACYSVLGLLLSVCDVYGQLEITTGFSATELADMLSGEGITIVDASLDCSSVASGKFDCIDCNLGIDSGFILTTGKAVLAEGPNNSSSTGFDNGWGGDPDLSDLPGVGATHNRCVLELDFIPVCDSVQFEYAFGSDEYNEYVGAINDVFALWISGPDIVDPVNIALIPGTSYPVSINSVNLGSYATYYNNNPAGGVAGSDPYYIEYDGFTDVFVALSAVTPGETYHLKFAIADESDHLWDSGVFFKAGSLEAGVSADFTMPGAGMGPASYCTDSPDPTPELMPGAIAGEFSASPDGLTIDPATGTIDISASIPGTYTITNAVVGYVCGGLDTIVATAEIILTELPVGLFSYLDSPFCSDTSDVMPTFAPDAVAGTFTAAPVGLSISPVTGSIDVSASVPGTYTVTNSIDASGACPAVTETTSVTIYAAYDLSQDFEICEGDTFYLPDGTAVTAAGEYETTLPTIAGCDSVITTTLTVSPVYTSTVEAEICAGDTYTLPDGTVTDAAGTYTSEFTSYSGCDSVVITELSVNPVYAIDQSATICEGDTFYLPDGTAVTAAGEYETVLTTIAGCDSAIATTLTVSPVYTSTVEAEICAGDTYTLPDGTVTDAAGTYTSEFTSYSGCDSVVITELSVNPVYAIDQSATICEGDTFYLPDGTAVTTAGDYETTLPTIAGCDSVIATALTVSPVYTSTVEAEICAGDTYILPDGTVTDAAGTYTSVFTSYSGCDSVVITELSVNPVYAIDQSATICEGDTFYLPDGTAVTAAGDYETTLPTIAGCDSVITTTLTIGSFMSTTVSAAICAGETYTLPDGTSADVAGTYTSVFTSYSGCDSVVITELSVNPVYEITQSATICEGDTFYLPDGTAVTTAGDYETVLTTIAGCDSVTTTTLTVSPVYTSTVEAEICAGDTYTLPDGTVTDAAGTYTSVFTSYSGCDSVVITELSVNPVYAIDQSATICEGETFYLPDGTAVTAAGEYETVLTTIAGCDSAITTTLTIGSFMSTTVSAAICAGETYTLPDGTSADAAGTYTSVFTSYSGCDSVVITELSVNPVYEITQSATICEGDTFYLPDGTAVTTAGDYETVLTTIAECDSVITTTLTIGSFMSTTVSAAICAGETYTLPDGTSADVAGTYTSVFTSYSGCDSVVITELSVNPVYAIDQSATICEGDTFYLPDGTAVAAAGEYETTLLTIAGCDSVITTTLTVSPVYTSTVEAEICAGETYILPDGMVTDAAGTYTSEFTSYSGCDSVVITELSVNPVYAIDQSATICEGDTFYLPDGTAVTTAGEYETTLLTIAGCDSAITTALTIESVLPTIIAAEICNGETYVLPDGTLTDTAGTYSFVFTSFMGCDSIVYLTLTVHPVYSTLVSASICADEVYLLPDSTEVNEPGTYSTVLSSVSGCDSIITTNLTVYPVYNILQSATICEGELYYLPDGTAVLTAGIYTTTLSGITGCDSVITTNLYVNPIPTTTMSASICPGETYTLPDGTITSAAGTYTTLLTSYTGCDSIIYTTLSIYTSYIIAVNDSICEGDVYVLPDGTPVFEAGVYSTLLNTIYGCDSVINTILEYYPSYAIELYREICTGEVYTLPDGTDVDEGGIYTTGFISVNGCDSVITTHLTIHPNPVITFSVDPLVCLEDGPVLLEAIPEGGVFSGISVSGNQFDPQDAGVGGPYEIIYVYPDIHGCKDTAFQFISVDQNYAIAFGDTTVLEGNPITISGVSGGDFSWEPAGIVSCPTCESSSAFPVESGYITLTSVNENGCEASDAVYVQVIPLPENTVFIPNAFTPNGDGVNDYVFAYSPLLVNIKSMEIFDRWGNRVFYGEDLIPDAVTSGWDGTFNGEAVSVGVYAYIVIAEFEDGEIKKFASNVTLLSK